MDPFFVMLVSASLRTGTVLPHGTVSPRLNSCDPLRSSSSTATVFP